MSCRHDVYVEVMKMIMVRKGLLKHYAVWGIKLHKFAPKINSTPSLKYSSLLILLKYT